MYKIKVKQNRIKIIIINYFVKNWRQQNNEITYIKNNLKSNYNFLDTEHKFSAILHKWANKLFE